MILIKNGRIEDNNKDLKQHYMIEDNNNYNN